MVRPGRALVALIIVTALWARSCSAQTPTGKMFGTVTDEQGVALPGVAVEATSPKLVGKAAAVTDENGVYRIFALTPGLYKVAFALQGFKTVTRDGIIVELEQSVKLNVAMPPGAIEEQVTVIGQSPLIDVKSTVKGMTMTKEVFFPAPRPGLRLAGRRRPRRPERTPALRRLGRRRLGLREHVLRRRHGHHQPYTGVRGQGVAFEFVDEVQVKASGYQAEYGGSLGGVIHVITRQGGNAFHGDVLGYYSGSGLNGKERDTLRLNPYESTSPSTSTTRTSTARTTSTASRPGSTSAGISSRTGCGSSAPSCRSISRRPGT